MSFLDSRLGVTFEYFQKKSIDMLYQKQNILSLGYDNWNSQIWMNIGSMQARGWEVGLTWRDEIGKDFSYDLGLEPFCRAQQGHQVLGRRSYQCWWIQ